MWGWTGGRRHLLHHPRPRGRGKPALRSPWEHCRVGCRMTSASKHSPHRTPTLSAASWASAGEGGERGRRVLPAAGGWGGPASQAVREEMTLQESCSRSLQASLSRGGRATGCWGHGVRKHSCHSALSPAPQKPHARTHVRSPWI